MNPQNLVTNLELSKRLFEEGITKDVKSVFWWVKHLPLSSAGIGWRVELKRSTPDSLKEESFPALTLEELLELIPARIERGEDTEDLWSLRFDKRPMHSLPPRYGAGYETLYCDDAEVGFVKDTALEALSSLTTWLLDEGYLKANS